MSHRRWQIAGITILWLFTACGLIVVWPIQPRFVLGTTSDFAIVGFTPESKQLIGLSPVSSQGPVKRQLFEAPISSGPVYDWDLKSGARRSQSKIGFDFPVPNQAEIVCGPKILLTPLQRGKDVTGKRQSVVLDLNTGIHTPIPYDYGRMELSPGGRWYLNYSSLREKDELRVVETSTGRERVRLSTGGGEIKNTRFSNDDRLFICTIVKDDDDVQTASSTIWRLESGDGIQTTQAIDDPVFSPSNRLVAGFGTSLHQRDSSNTQFGQPIFVLDAESGRTLRKSPIINDESCYPLGFIDENWMLYRSNTTSYVISNTMQLKFAWNVVTNEHFDYTQTPEVMDASITACRNFSDWSPTHYVPRNEKTRNDAEVLYQVTTGKPIATVPQTHHPIRLTRDGRTLLMQPRRPYRTRLANFTEFLETKGISIPVSIFPQSAISRRPWTFIDVASGQTLAQIPEQDDIHWISPDEKTIVTTANGMINVWDLPPRRSLVSPLVWSLIMPIAGLVFGWSQRQRRRRSAAHSEYKTPPGNHGS